MGRLADGFADAARACVDLPQLRALLAEAAHELGFDHFALLHHASLSTRQSALVRIDNYPQSWAREFRRRRLAASDPVHLASRRTNVGFCWSELRALVNLERKHCDIIDRSRHHGIGEGFTVPANVPGEPSASCSFAMRAGRDLPARRLRSAELVGAHALCAARRIYAARTRAQPPHLSRRQVDCLRLVAVGKTDWEIARILGLSVDTAHQYVKSARGAYDVVSRTQLVVYGLRDNWISFEDAIPSDG